MARIAALPPRPEANEAELDEELAREEVEAEEGVYWECDILEYWTQRMS